MDIKVEWKSSSTTFVIDAEVNAMTEEIATSRSDRLVGLILRSLSRTLLGAIARILATRLDISICRYLAKVESRTQQLYTCSD